MEALGHYSRGYLPHEDLGEVPQFITWRLHDSVPAHRISEWQEELANLPEPKRRSELYRRIERYMDTGHGSCILENPVAAHIVRESLYFGHASRYVLHAWVIMPNHVHVLFTPCSGWALKRIMKDLKGYTTKEIHKALGGYGSLWQEDYYDKWIRDGDHFERVAKYIEWNPVKAKLCTDPLHYPNSSRNPVMRDRMVIR